MRLTNHILVFAALLAVTIGPPAAVAQPGSPPNTNVDPALLDEFAPPTQGARGTAAPRRGGNAIGTQAPSPRAGVAQSQNTNAATPPPVEQVNEGASNAGDNRTAMTGAPNRLFLALDANGDGLLSLAELRRAATTARSLDSDGDGNISLAEAGGGQTSAAAAGIGVASAQGGPADQALAQYDKNADGKLTANEMPAEMARMFSQMDANRDGELNRDELNAAAAAMAAQWGGMMGPMGPGGGNLVGGIGQIMQYDRNRDNRITADEIPPQLAAMLRGADRNGDGAIDMQEIAGIAQQAQGMGPANRGFGPGGGVPPGGGERNGRGNE